MLYRAASLYMAEGMRLKRCRSTKMVYLNRCFRILNQPRNVDSGLTRSALRQALQLWSDKSVLTFREVSNDFTTQSDGVDIDVSFASRYHNDGYEFDGKGSLIAVWQSSIPQRRCNGCKF